MKPYEWMVISTPQRQWAEKRSIFAVIAFYSGPLGAALYLLSLFFNSLSGMVVSLFIVAFVKGGAHLLELSRPLKSWRMPFRVQSSWISRGMILIAFFLGSACIQVLLHLFYPGTASEVFFKILAALGAIALSLYSGFVLTQVRAIQLWNSSLLPILLSATGLTGALGFMGIIALFDQSTSIMKISMGAGVMIIIISILLAAYIVFESGSGSVGTLRRILKDREIAPFVWVGLFTVGMVVPFALATIEYFGQNINDTALAVVILLCTIVQGLSLVYAILKGGMYRPLIPIA